MNQVFAKTFSKNGKIPQKTTISQAKPASFNLKHHSSKRWAAMVCNVSILTQDKNAYSNSKEKIELRRPKKFVNLASQSIRP